MGRCNSNAVRVDSAPNQAEWPTVAASGLTARRHRDGEVDRGASTDRHLCRVHHSAACPFAGPVFENNMIPTFPLVSACVMLPGSAASGLRAHPSRCGLLELAQDDWAGIGHRTDARWGSGVVRTGCKYHALQTFYAGGRMAAQSVMYRYLMFRFGVSAGRAVVRMATPPRRTDGDHSTALLKGYPDSGATVQAHGILD
ncbi:hypothetical protein LZ30DRAFT_767510 [Colletotrichum cereale]|nr:hypothetical protein LZ30DRAFT_767510 [Colletotrichum cereale]